MPLLKRFIQEAMRIINTIFFVPLLKVLHVLSRYFTLS